MAGLPTMTTYEFPGARIEVGSEAGGLDARLSRELTRFNVAATGVDDGRELTVTALDEQGELIAGLSGWTWGTAAGIGMVWVHDDHRRASWGGRLLRAAEDEARARGCTPMTVSSFTFQAPSFYQKHKYVEFARTEGIPRPGHADVHMRKDLHD
jgi:GNAT superfamily N-acetyltransferase